MTIAEWLKTDPLIMSAALRLARMVRNLEGTSKDAQMLARYITGKLDQKK